MIPHGVEVFIGLEPIDLRWSFDRLAGIVVGRLGRVLAYRARSFRAVIGCRRFACG